MTGTRPSRAALFAGVEQLRDRRAERRPRLVARHRAGQSHALAVDHVPGGIAQHSWLGPTRRAGRGQPPARRSTLGGRGRPIWRAWPSILLGGSAWESNPPRDAERRATGFEDQGSHRAPTAPSSMVATSSGRRAHPIGGGIRHAAHMRQRVVLAAVKVVHTVAFGAHPARARRRASGQAGSPHLGRARGITRRGRRLRGQRVRLPADAPRRALRRAARFGRATSSCPTWSRGTSPGAARSSWRSGSCSTCARSGGTAAPDTLAESTSRPGGTPLAARLVALIPGYNEGPRIGPVVEATLRHLPVLVVDDGSADDTAEQAAPPARRSSSSARTRARARPCAPASDVRSPRATTRSSRSTPTASTTRPRSRSSWPPSRPTRGRTSSSVGATSARCRPPAAWRTSWAAAAFSWAVGRPIPDNQSGYRLIGRRIMEATLGSDEGGFEFEVEMITTCIRLGGTIAWVPIRTI